MKRLKDIRKIVILAVIMIVIGLFFSFSKSYAYFESSIAGSNITMGVGKLIHSLNSDVKLKSGEKKEINLFVKSNDDIDSKYQVYYTSDDDLTDISVGYSSDSIDLPSGEISAKGSKRVTIVLENNSDKEVSVEIGVRGGLINNSVDDIVLEEKEYRIVDVLEGVIEIGNINVILNSGETYNIPQGYHDGTGKVIASSSSSSLKTVWLSKETPLSSWTTEVGKTYLITISFREAASGVSVNGGTIIENTYVTYWTGKYDTIYIYNITAVATATTMSLTKDGCYGQVFEL